MLLKTELLSKYFLLFCNSFMSDWVLGMQSEYILPTMHMLGYNKFLIYFTAFLAYLCSNSANYFVGTLLYRFTLGQYKNEALEKRREEMGKVFAKLIMLLLILNFFTPFNKLITLFLGFLNYQYLRLLGYLAMFKIMHILLFSIFMHI